MGAKTIEIKCGYKICSVAFLPDGKNLVCGGWECKTRRWQVESGREVGGAMDAGSCILNLAVSPNGKWVVSGTKDGRVTVWNAETHEKATEIDTHAKAVYAVDVSPDSRHIATESDEKAVCVWSISTGERVLGPWKHDGSIAGIKYSPNGALIATASLERNSIRIYDSKDGRLLVPDISVGVSAYLNQSFTWATDSRRLIVLSRGGNVKYLDVTTGRVGSQWAIHSNDKPRCIALASNGKFIATSANSSISFWDTTTYKQIGDVLQHGGSVRTMAISPNIDHLASGGDDQKITLRSLGDALPESYLVGTVSEEVDIKKTNEAPLQDNVRVQEESPVSDLDNPSSSTDSAGASRVEIDVQSGTNCIAFLTDGMLITSTRSEGKVRRWRTEDGHEVGTTMDAGGFVLNLVVSRDGKWVVGGTRSGLVRVWNAQSQEKVAEIEGHEKPVGSIDISPDGTRIATGSDDSTACIWSIASGERLLGPLKHDGKLAAVKYSSSGEFIATATCSHESVRVYKCQDGSLVADIQVRVGSHMNDSLAWSLHNEQLFVLSKHGIIHCLDAATGSTHSEWSAHANDKVWWCIALASTGTFVATSTSSSVLFWDATTHKQIGNLQCGNTVFSMILSPNTEHLVTCGDDKKITIRKVADIIPESYLVGSDSREREVRRVEGANTGIERPDEQRKESSESHRNRLSVSTTGNDHQVGEKRIVMDGRNTVWSVEFLARGTYFVSGGSEGKVRRWRAEDGCEVGTEMDAGSHVFDLAGSRDGKWVVSGTQSGSVKVWNAESHEKVNEIHGHAKAVGAVDISPDAKRVATGSDDSTACVWSLASGERLLGPLNHDGRLAAVKHSPNGDFIATATCSHESVRVYKSLDGSLIADIQVRVGSYINQSLAWSLDSKQLYALTKYGNVHCIDVATGTTHSKWSIQDGDKPRCISLAPNGSFIAASVNSLVTFWDSTTHNQIGDVLQYDDTISSMAISPNNEHLVSGGDDKKISLQDLRGILPESYFIRVDIDKINEPPSANVREESNGDRSLIPTGDLHQTRTRIIVMDGRNSIRSVTFLVDGTRIVSGGSEGKLRYWRVEDGREVGTTVDAGGRVLNSAVSRDGRWIVSGADNGRVVIWSAENREQVGEIKGHAKAVGAVDISPDATRIVTGSDDSTACVWSISSGEPLLDPLKHDHALVAVKYSPSGDLIATATWSRKSVRIYKNQDGSLLFNFQISVNSALNQSIAWSIDGEQLFALSKYGHIHCLDVATGTTHSEWAIHSIDKPRCIALARNGTFIAASANSSISFWDPTTHRQIGDVLQYGDAVRSVAISIDNGQLVSGGDDKKITLRSLREVLPQFYFIDTDPREPEIRRMRKKKTELEKTNESLRTLLRAHEQKHQCEALYSEDRAKDAADSLCKFVDAASDVVKSDKIIMDWISEFTKRCAAKLGDMGDAASSAGNHNDAIAAYSTALSLSSPKDVLLNWAKTILAHDSVDGALSAATKFKFSKVTIRQAICDVLEGADRVTEAIEVLDTIASELGKDPRVHEEHTQWMLNFQQRCIEKIEKLGDAAMGSRKYAEAVEQYTTALSRKPTNIVQILAKRSSARSLMGLWEEALDDADEAIKLDPSYHRGYESRHAALHARKRHTEAATAFKKMLSILEQSPDMKIRTLRRQYVDASATIRRVIDQTVRDMPRVLIDTTSGCLLDKTRQALAFEELPIYGELVSSMTTQLDLERIRREVKEYYRYVMLSHKWEDNEPLLQKVENISVYELEASPENTKLQLFCSIVRSLGFKWAWSDTCCVDKTNHVVLQESLVAMFTWYHGSSLTIVYLRGVLSQSGKPGDLRNSIWNTRAWTYQEYVASKVVQFYTEDWKPYLGLDIFNHRQSPAIISEMEQATGVSAQKLVTLRPGLDRVREKLYLASARQTTLVEDAAYSLFGIFNVAITVIYGEGNRAVGRLLEHIVTGSGDVTVLAWTGHSGRYNSCLPVDLAVYNESHAPHVPLPIDNVDIINLVDALRASFPDPDPAEKLYDRLNELPLPSLAFSRLKLSGICFPVDELVPTSRSNSESNLRVYRATTPALADIEIKTSEDLSEMKNLLLVHPWIRPLLDQEFSQGAFAFDKTTRALRFLACLMQPFGALLVAPLSRVEYKRVAADSPIVVQICKEVSLSALMDNIRTIDIQ